jgi:hypothetical protein
LQQIPIDRVVAPRDGIPVGKGERAQPQGGCRGGAGNVDQTLQRPRQASDVARLEIDAAVAQHRPILRNVTGQHWQTIRQRLQQRHRHALDIRRQDEQERIAEQLGQFVPGPMADEDDPRRIGARPQGGDVIGAAGAAGHHQAHIRGQAREGIDQIMAALLRHQPAGEQDIAPRHQPRGGEERAGGNRLLMRHAVRDEGHPDVIPFQKVAAQRFGHHGHAGRAADQGPLRGPQTGAREPAPFVALAVESVDRHQ